MVEPFGFSTYCLIGFVVLGNFVEYVFADKNINSSWDCIKVLLEITILSRMQGFVIFFVFDIVVDIVALVTSCFGSYLFWL